VCYVCVCVCVCVCVRMCMCTPAAHTPDLTHTYTHTYGHTKEHKLAQTFAHSLPKHKLSMAELQGHLLSYKSSPSAAVTHAHDLISSAQHLTTSYHHFNAKSGVITSQSQNSVHKQLNVSRWLLRLGLEQYIHGFHRANITDVRYLSKVSFGAGE